MRVLMVSKACVVGIYQQKLEHIARHDAIDLLVIVPPSWRDERGETRLERVYTDGYRMEITPLRFNGNFHLHYFHGLREFVCDFQPHIMHIDEEPYNLATWHALRTASYVDAKTLFFSWQNINRRYPPPFSFGEQWVLRHIDYAIAGTKSAAQVWRQKGYTGPLAVIPQFGVDPTLFAPTDERPTRPFTIGYIGRLVEEKGIALLLKAAAQLRDPHWQMRIIGGGPQRDDLARQAARLGIAQQVTFVEQLPSTEMPAQYHRLDVLVLPSLTRPNWKEQFGRVLIEAMASGVPVIGSSSGAIPDVIGEAGLIFAEGDPDALTQQLTQVQGDADLRDCLRKRGRERVLTRFTHEQVAAATVRVYHEMMA
ncbi:MAG: glycosyltransferase family 1 protein [Chloroflexi bacterium]|nr:MAG: glycosyltransferase family 1 protein [Chloroflexota bacterium]